MIFRHERFERQGWGGGGGGGGGGWEESYLFRIGVLRLGYELSAEKNNF